MTSRVLPVRFVLRDDHIGVVDTRTGQLALRYEELQQILRQELEAQARLRAEAGALRQRLEQEAAARREAELNAARLQAELDRLRRDRGRGEQE